MKILQGKEKEQAVRFIKAAAEEAKKSTCERAKGGSVIVKDGEVIGKGYNSPPAELEVQRRCSLDKNDLHRKITDKTCCIHAEQRAIFNALKENPDSLQDSTIYFVNVNEIGEPIFAGNPYCTICSKMSLDCGIRFFVLYHEDGVYLYDTKEYNLLSYQYKG